MANNKKVAGQSNCYWEAEVVEAYEDVQDVDAQDATDDSDVVGHWEEEVAGSVVEDDDGLADQTENCAGPEQFVNGCFVLTS